MRQALLDIAPNDPMAAIRRLPGDSPTGGASADAAHVTRECHDCGLFQTLPPVEPGRVAHCMRCNAVLRRGRRDPLIPTLALTVTGLLLLGLALAMPFLHIELLGRDAATRFTTGAAALDEDGMWELALVVLATTVVAPLVKLACTLIVLVGLHSRRPPRQIYLLFRLAVWLRPWAMVEVYMLGIFVAYTKLVQLATIDVGAAAYSLGALMFAMVAADAALDPEAVWEGLEARRLVFDPAALAGPPANAARPAPIGCTVCGRVHHAVDGTACPRCGTALHPRKRNSLRRTACLVVAATILYIPANLYPVLTLISLGRGEPSTILGGVRDLATAGMWPLALLVFFASITVPVLKIIGLTIMLIGVRRKWRRHLRDRTTLYRLIEFVGRWSMIDVFMISILVGLVHLGVVASVTPGIGAVAFASVVILTMLAAMTFDPRLMWDADRRNPQQPATRTPA